MHKRIGIIISATKQPATKNKHTVRDGLKEGVWLRGPPVRGVIKVKKVAKLRRPKKNL